VWPGLCVYVCLWRRFWWVGPGGFNGGVSETTQITNKTKTRKKKKALNSWGGVRVYGWVPLSGEKKWVMEQTKRETELKLLCYCCCYQVTSLFSSSVSVPCVVNQWVERGRERRKRRTVRVLWELWLFFPWGIFGCCDYIVPTDTCLSIWLPFLPPSCPCCCL